jgi:hypothetical protein
VTDLSIQDEGSIYLLRPHSDAGKEWIAEHIPDTAIWFGGAVVIEHRFIGDIAQGAVNDGLEVE